MRKRGIRVKLQDQPFRILCLLLDSHGAVVSRETLCAALWPGDTFVDFERSLNAAVAKLRVTLGDSAENPRFVETVARRGYRFIAPVDSIDPLPPEAVAEITPAVSGPLVADSPARRWTAVGRLAAFSVLGTAVAAGLLLFLFESKRSALAETPYAVMHRLTSDQGLTEEPAVSRDGTLLAYASDRDSNGHLEIWVQQLSGGSAIRLTTANSDCHQPSFSPDGTQIVYRSEADGGIYLVPSLGGSTRLVAKDGRDPSFSPDGKWISYWVGNLTTDSLNAGEVYLVPASGGAPRRLETSLKVGYPVWAEDGRHLLVLGGQSYFFNGDFDWWVFAPDGRSSSKTGAFQAFRKQGFPLEFVENTYPPRISQWIGDELIFSVGTGDSTNIWSIRLSPDNLRVEGAPRRLTSGEGLQSQPQRIPGDRLVFTGFSKSANLWSLSVDTNRGIDRTDKPQPVTDKGSLEHFGSISADGRYLVFISTRSGKAHLWMKDLSNGRENRITTTDEPEERPEISPDGSVIAYANAAGVSIVSRIRSGGAESLCSDCGYPWDWSHNNRTLLYLERKPVWAIGSFDPQTGRKSIVLEAARWPLYQSRFSPDEKWLAFGQQVNYSNSRLFIAAMRNGKAAPESEWIPIGHQNGWCDKPRWSPDGSLIYFISQSDGYRCLWAQRLAPDTKRPLGAPFSLAHLHSARLSMLNVSTGSLEIEVTRDKLIFNLGEFMGNIWMASRK